MVLSLAVNHMLNEMNVWLMLSVSIKYFLCYNEEQKKTNALACF